MRHKTPKHEVLQKQLDQAAQRIGVIYGPRAMQLALKRTTTRYTNPNSPEWKTVAAMHKERK